MAFRDYVDDVWFPHHVLEPSTRQNYRYNLDQHILSTFGPMKISSLLPVHVRQWVTALVAAGVSPQRSGTTRSCCPPSLSRRSTTW